MCLFVKRHRRTDSWSSPGSCARPMVRTKNSVLGGSADHGPSADPLRRPVPAPGKKKHHGWAWTDEPPPHPPPPFPVERRGKKEKTRPLVEDDDQDDENWDDGIADRKRARLKADVKRHGLGGCIRVGDQRTDEQAETSSAASRKTKHKSSAAKGPASAPKQKRPRSASGHDDPGAPASLPRFRRVLQFRPPSSLTR